MWCKKFTCLQFGITHLFFAAQPAERARLHGFSDADFAGDATTRRSTAGFVFLIGDAPISWRSKLQSSVALSTTESEYIALSHATQEAAYLRQLLHELGATDDKPTVIYEDNQAAIAIANNEQYHGRLKHIDVRVHFVRQQVQLGRVTVEFCPTQNMVADIMTKPLPKPAYSHLVRRLLKDQQTAARAQ